MDTTDHGHVPYVYILVRALEDWKAAVRRPLPRRARPFMTMYSTTGYRLRLTQKSKNSSPF